MKTKRFLTAWSILLGLFLLLLSPLPGSATVLFSDNFNTENGGLVGALNYVGFANWDLTRGSVDLIGDAAPNNFFPPNGLYVDLDGTSNASGQMTSKATFTLFPGITYALQYDLAGNQRTALGGIANIVQISLSPVFSVTRTFQPTDPLTTFIDTFTVASQQSGKLIFDQIDGNNNDIGPILDNVILGGDIPIPVPIPGAVVLLGSGLLGLAGLGWRSRKKN